MKKVFIDGAAGTTGLKIHDRLSKRDDIKIISLDEEYRKDILARKDAINSSDVAFLCLPDAAAIEAADLTSNPDTVIIDTSTAHRTDDNWVYGFAELKGQRDKIKLSKRIANPGCHASGVIALVKPLIDAGVISADLKLSAFSLTGYSGGGKKMIAEYEDPANVQRLKAPRMYGLTQAHKHIPEIKKVCGLNYEPVFCPIVSSFYSGMQTTVSLFSGDLTTDISGIKEIYADYYKTGLVRFSDNVSENGFLSSATLEGFDNMIVSVLGNADRLTLVSVFDNLGKGACGAAIQNMNISLGIDENLGLYISEG